MIVRVTVFCQLDNEAKKLMKKLDTDGDKKINLEAFSAPHSTPLCLSDNTQDLFSC